MSLQVWLPLNGDLHNQGLSDLMATPVGTVAYDNSGKIGKCFISGGTTQTSNGIEINSNLIDILNSPNGSSIALWVKPVGNHVHYNGTFISSGNWNATRWSFGVSQNNSQVDVLCKGHNNYITCAVPVNEWTHLVGVFKNGTSKVYKNGMYVGELTGVAPTFDSDASNTCIGRETYASGYFGFNGRINDVRIYDHALSAAEVAEIAKGLILHYKLDNNGLGNENYWTNGKPQVNTWNNSQSYSKELRTMFGRTSTNYTSSPSAIVNEYIEIKFLSTREQIDNGSCQLQKIQRYTNTINGMCPILENLKEGEYFTISYELYISSPVNVKFMIGKRLNGTISKNETSLFQVSTINTWTKISQSIQITSDFDKSNITANVDYLLAAIAIQDILGVTTSDEVVIRIRNIKLERGQEATSWIPARADFGHIDDNIIYDCSGYQNNGTIIGELTAAADSPRYQVATYMNNRNTANRIQSNKEVDFNSDNNLTVSFWAKCDKTVSQVLFVMPKLEFAFNTTAAYVNPATSMAGFSMTNFITNQWNHIVVILSGTTYSCYINNVIATSAGSRDYWRHDNNFLYLFNRNRNNNYAADATISDFRIYTTVLTPEQIADLYHTSMSIDANGNAYTRELVE